MKSIRNTKIHLPALAGAAALLLSALLSGQGQAALLLSDNFDGTTLNPTWVQSGTASGHIGLNGSGQYILCAVDGAGGSNLRWQTTDMPKSFSAEVDVSMNPFFNPNTQTDFKWRFFGPDGFVEVVLNSFGSIRAFSSDASGNVGGPTNISGSFSDGDLLNLTLNYNEPADTFLIDYGINGGTTTNLATYTGAGDFYTNWADVQVFKFSDGLGGGKATIALDRFTIAAIPEPSRVVLLGIGFAGLLLRRQRSPRA